MPIAKKPSDFKLIPEELLIGVCYAIIDLGTQFSEKWGKEQRKVCLIWELPDIEPIEIDGKDMPRVISRIYTLSLGSKALLRQHLESWRGKKFTKEQLDGFDLKVLLGQNCQIQIVHEHKGEDTYTNISTIVNVPKGHKKVEPVNPTVVYEIGDTIPDDVIPEWICKIIREAREWEWADNDSQEVPEEQSDVEPF